MTTEQQAEIRLRDLDGLGEIRVTAWTVDGQRIFRFATHHDGDDEPGEVFDLPADSAYRLAIAMLAL